MGSEVIFAYWHGDDRTPIADMEAHWRQRFPEFRVIGDNEARPLIEKNFGDVLEMYDRIAIPACRSDIARLAMLYEHGGVYVDCDVALWRPRKLGQLIKRLGQYELVVFDRWGARDANYVVKIVNTFVLARARSSVLRLIADRAIANLREQYQSESSGRSRQYDISPMTGPKLFDKVLLTRPLPLFGRRLKRKFRDSVFVVPEVDGPFARAVYQDYRVPGMHWTQRQKREPLFLPAAE